MSESEQLATIEKALDQAASSANLLTRALNGSGLKEKVEEQTSVEFGFGCLALAVGAFKKQGVDHGTVEGVLAILWQRMKKLERVES